MIRIHGFIHYLVKYQQKIQIFQLLNLVYYILKVGLFLIASNTAKRCALYEWKWLMKTGLKYMCCTRYADILTTNQDFF